MVFPLSDVITLVSHPNDAADNADCALIDTLNVVQCIKALY